MNRFSQLQPLGLQRLRLLECIGGNNSKSPMYFSPTQELDIFREFYSYVEQLQQKLANETDQIVISLLASAHLLCGKLDFAEIIIDKFPENSIKLDHGAGICLVLHLHILSTIIPWPDDMKDTAKWIQNSPKQTALKNWLSDHRQLLYWDDVEGVYKIN